MLQCVCVQFINCDLIITALWQQMPGRGLTAYLNIHVPSRIRVERRNANLALILHFMIKYLNPLVY